MKKNYKSDLMYYCKLFENDILNHRVIEEKPAKFRRDLAGIAFACISSRFPVLEGWVQGRIVRSSLCLPVGSTPKIYSPPGKSSFIVIFCIFRVCCHICTSVFQKMWIFSRGWYHFFIKITCRLQR